MAEDKLEGRFNTSYKRRYLKKGKKASNSNKLFIEERIKQNQKQAELQKKTAQKLNKNAENLPIPVLTCN